MKYFTRIVFTSILLTGSTLAAEDNLGLSGSGKLGFVGARGNTTTESLNIGAELTYNTETWRYTGALNALKASEDDLDTSDRVELKAKADYKVSDNSYWFGSGRYENDEFSEFDFQSTFAAGYGRKLINNEKHLLEGELGAGYRMADVRATGESADEAILRAALKYRWNITDTAALTNGTLIEAGSDNTFASNIVALETKISSGLGLNLSYEIRHNTDVNEPTENSDFLTTVSIVYSF